jgi:hypothetical protein
MQGVRVRSTQSVRLVILAVELTDIAIFYAGGRQLSFVDSSVFLHTIIFPWIPAFSLSGLHGEKNSA